MLKKSLADLVQSRTEITSIESNHRNPCDVHFSSAQERATKISQRSIALDDCYLLNCNPSSTANQVVAKTEQRTGKHHATPEYSVPFRCCRQILQDVLFFRCLFIPPVLRYSQFSNSDKKGSDAGGKISFYNHPGVTDEKQSCRTLFVPASGNIKTITFALRAGSGDDFFLPNTSGRSIHYHHHLLASRQVFHIRHHRWHSSIVFIAVQFFFRSKGLSTGRFRRRWRDKSRSHHRNRPFHLDGHSKIHGRGRYGTPARRDTTGSLDGMHPGDGLLCGTTAPHGASQKQRTIIRQENNFGSSPPEAASENGGTAGIRQYRGVSGREGGTGTTHSTNTECSLPIAAHHGYHQGVPCAACHRWRGFISRNAGDIPRSGRTGGFERTDRSSMPDCEHDGGERMRHGGRVDPRKKMIYEWNRSSIE